MGAAAPTGRRVRRSVSGQAGQRATEVAPPGRFAPRVGLRRRVRTRPPARPGLRPRVGLRRRVRTRPPARPGLRPSVGLRRRVRTRPRRRAPGAARHGGARSRARRSTGQLSAAPLAGVWSETRTG